MLCGLEVWNLTWTKISSTKLCNRWGNRISCPLKYDTFNSFGIIKLIFLVSKVIKNKFTGEAAGYGFINFINDHVALTAMHKLNGKLMPSSSPPVR